MSLHENYLDINRQSWNNRLETHMASTFYNVDQFIKGESSLNEIELELLGDIRGKSILHLQCHFGQDSISLARLGASVTGVDLSDKAIEAAQQLAEKCQADATFICCDLYSLPQYLDQKFDMVFSSYGTIGWLPDLDKWAQIISRFLKPRGSFIFAEFHPVVWMFDDQFTHIAYRYFNGEPIIETEQGTYADMQAPISQQYVCWNHSLSEVINSLLQQGLQITAFHEYDYSPYPCFQSVKAIAPKKYRIAHLEDKIPMVFALTAIQNARSSIVE
jgi:ubiquinone/menaquinone biosynthesis C-methylase UbiE